MSTRAAKKTLTEAQIAQRRRAADVAAERRRIARLDAEFEEELARPYVPTPETQTLSALVGMNYIAPQQQAQQQAPTNRVITYITKSLKEQKKSEALIHSPSDVLTWKVNLPYIMERSNGTDNSPTLYDLVDEIGNDTSYSYAIMVEYIHTINTIPSENVVEVSKTGRYVYNTPNNTHVVIHTPVMYDFPNNTYSPEKAQQFMRVLLGQYPEEKAYYIKLYKDEAYPQPFELFTAIDSNCVMNVIAEYIAKNPTYLKKKGKVHNPQPLFDDILATITPEHGFTIAHAKEVYSKLELNLVIHHNGGIWYDNKNSRKHKTITIFAHDKHATVYRPVIKPINVVYMPEEQYGLTIQDHAPTVVYGSITLQNDYDNLDYKKVYFNIKAYQQCDTVYKSFRPPVPDDTNPEYYLSNSILSYAYKKWKTTNNLRAPSDPYYEVIRASEHLLGTQKFSKITNKELYLCDINKAYPSFQTHSLYPRFKLPLGYYNMGTLSMPVLDIVSLTGWSRISNITLNHQLLSDIAYLQEGCVYTHVRLYHLLINNLASFTIDMTIVSQPEHIDMPFLTDTILTDEEKRFNNAFIGNMIASNKENKKYYTSEDQRELEQIIYDAKKDENTLYATRISEKVVEISLKITEKKGLYNIHSYIIDYAQTTMIDGMLSQYDRNIVAFHTDGFFTEKEPTITSSRTWGAFKVEKKRINFESKDTAPVHRQHTMPTYLPKITPYKHTLTIGPPGVGKSKQIFTNAFYSSILTCPTHKLKNTHKTSMATSTLPDRPIKTYHKYFQLGCLFKREPTIYENIYIDECSMISKEVLKHIHDFASTYRVNIHLIGDIDEDGIHQLPPVSTGTNKATPLDISDFSEYNIVRVCGTQRRQNVDDCVFLDSLRGMPYYEVLELVKNRVRTCSVDDISTLYTEDTLGVVSLHARAKVLNNIVYKRDIQNNVPTIRLRSTVNRKKNGEVCVATGELLVVPRNTVQLSRIFMDRTSATQTAPSGTMYELGYFNTCDAVQGMTHRGRLIIDTVGAHRENLLYTALTRATDLNNVYLII